MRRARRGQGTLELALGLTLLVPVLMIGWAFAEAGFLSLKVHEAAESAMWDVTAQPNNRGVTAAMLSANDRYADFDGRLSRPGPGPRVGVATQASSMAVTCTLTPVTMSQPILLDPVIPAPLGTTCSARATVALFAGGTVLGLPWQGITMDQCSTGRPDGYRGPCAAVPVLALSDGALADHQNCDVQDDGLPCNNAEYFRKVKQLYDDTGGAQGRDALDLVRDTLGGGMLGLPLGARTALDTYLSSWGEDAPAMPFAQENKHQADGDERRWFTTPFAQPPGAVASYGARESCYLGMYCTGESIERP